MWGNALAASHGALELRTGPEARALPRRNLDRLIGAGIAPATPCTLTHTERAESSNADFLALRERILDRLKDRIDDRRDLALPRVRAFRYRLDKIAFSHGSTPLVGLPNP